MTAPSPQDVQWALGINFLNFKNLEDRIKRYANQSNAQQEYLNKYNQQLYQFDQAISIIEFQNQIVAPFYPSIINVMKIGRDDPELYAVDMQYIIHPRKPKGNRTIIRIN
ncbi:hypothetical protein LX69_03380 [Breznakibacter xylanolyticus]|uniref:Uncharacterized protein n=1 Tax=Breznakibacter xylanolyticus TaxID=990 RepID=A0A2W7MQ79_9BACT|nr:hypothetical protein [Breznakibacter xylanolyticus]PZX10365.1 hypothetical protein LX69_03380 [Breznakibacter xylanolyticus]